jgi:ferredoxin
VDELCEGNRTWIFEGVRKMHTVTIDGRQVSVPPGTTILAAAERAGITIPTLCFWLGKPPQSSCFVCVVKVTAPGSSRFLPACAAPVTDGMIVESETAEVHHLRRRALELLLGHHRGDCLAPCQLACPVHLNVPVMLRQIRQGDFQGALLTIKQEMAFAGLLGRLCSRPCEKACRRSQFDREVSICTLKRLMVDWELLQQAMFLPPVAPATGKTVLIVGAGITGLSAAWYLRQEGHHVIVRESGNLPAARLREALLEQTSPPSTEIDPQTLLRVLDHEVGAILQLGVAIEVNWAVSPHEPLQSLLRQVDALLLACGAEARELASAWNLELGRDGVAVDRQTFQTRHPQVFAAGTAIRGKTSLVRKVADGKQVAQAIHSFLLGVPIEKSAVPWSVRSGRWDQEELQLLAARTALVEAVPLPDPLGNPQPDFPSLFHQAMEQAERCFRCNCQAADFCKLRQLAAQYGADPNRYSSLRPPLTLIDRRGDVIYEPGKCIACGRCVLAAEEVPGILGISFVGRGFDVRIGTPFDRSFAEALGAAADACIAACPTGALYRREPPGSYRSGMVEIRDLSSAGGI